jgi:hypothetical protein
MNKYLSKRELLKYKVVNLVKEFIKNEGVTNSHDIYTFFWPPTSYSEVQTPFTKYRLLMIYGAYDLYYYLCSLNWTLYL